MISGAKIYSFLELLLLEIDVINSELSLVDKRLDNAAVSFGRQYPP